MRLIELDEAATESLVDQLATYDSMKDLPRAERAWMVAHGELRAYDRGETVITVADVVEEMVVVLSGRIVVWLGIAGGRRHAMDSRAGSLTGVVPYSRLTKPQWDVFVEEPTELLAIHKDTFPDMIRECPTLVATLVHIMLDRARRFAAATWQDEKVIALGRLAAGLAHELNNPSSAAASGAQQLTRAIADVGAAAHAVGLASLTEAQRAGVVSLISGCQQPDRRVTLGAMERTDLEEQVGNWLGRNGQDQELATALVDGGVSMEALESLRALLDDAQLAAALRWVAAAAGASIVAADVERATRRIDDLVRAVRGYSWMDRAPVRERTDIGKGLADTVEVVRAEANGKQATIRLEVEPGLPPVSAVAPDLNQAWANLIQNAVDAVSSGGAVVVGAVLDNGSVIVRVVDDGPGIPEDIQPRIFDPFFTTKPAGAGAGLGLDIVRRIARANGGDVDFETRPGRTEFRVRLPVAAT